MANVYTVSFKAGTVIANGSLIGLRAATAFSSRASLLTILECRVSQHGTSTGQELGVQIAAKASAFDTFVNATPAAVMVGGVASGITASTSMAAASSGVNASALGGGTLTPIIVDAFNNLNGWLYVPVPEARITVGPDQAIVVALIGTPTTLTSWNATLTFLEGE
jgi:hypothetical protein